MAVSFSSEIIRELFSKSVSIGLNKEAIFKLLFYFAIFFSMSITI